MAYIANHMIRHNGTLYQKGDEVKLSYEEASELLKHRAVTKLGKPPGNDNREQAEKRPAAKAAGK